MSQKALERFRDHQKLSKQTGGVVFSDIEQNVGFTSASPEMPCLTRKASIFDFTSNRFATPKELFISQGHAVEIEGVVSVEPAMGMGCPNIWSITSPTEQMSLLGNSLHITTMGCWLLYCLANVMFADEFDDDFNFRMEHDLSTG